MATKNNENLSLKKEIRTFEFRKESFEIVFHFYFDKKTGDQFTTTDLDRLNLVQVHNQYRSKYGIPFIDEIKAIREFYGLSASKMSTILGLGTNVYRSYETGEIPSVATGRLIQLIKDPEEFRKLFDLTKNEFKTKEIEHIYRITESRKKNRWMSDYPDDCYFQTKPSITNGYKSPNLERIGNMVKYFTSRTTPFKTQLYMLLFCADFIHYKHHGFGISGISYLPVTNNPIPKYFGHIYDHLFEHDFIDLTIVRIGDYEGEKLVNHDGAPDLEKFEKTEVQVMQDVAGLLTETSKNSLKKRWSNITNEIKILSQSSDQETPSRKSEISYNKAFDLNYW